MGKKAKPGYKLVQTKFRGDYEIPKKWELSRLGNVCKFEYGKGLTEENRDNKGYFVYGSGGIVGKNSKFFTKGPGVIVARKGSLGNVFFEEGNFWPIDTVYYISKNETNHYLPFVFYLLTNLKLENYKIVTAHPGISRDEVYTIFVKIPTLDEQQKIASILSNVDDSIQKIIEEIEKTKLLKIGLMQTLLTKGIGHKKFKEINFHFGKIISIPEIWKLGKLREYTLKIGSGITPRGGSKIYKTTGIPLIRSQNVQFDGLKLDDVVFITKDIHEKMKNTKLGMHDVLLNITGASIGRCTYVPDHLKEGNVNQHVCIIRPKKDVDYRFLTYFLSTKFMQDIINSSQAGISRQGLNFEEIGNYLIPIPHIDEQKEIAFILNNINSRINHLESKKSNLQIIKKGLMQKLLTGQLRV